MKKSKEQIVRILEEVEAGAKVAEICRKHKISEPTYYNWKQKYAGMEVSQLRRLKDLEHECSQLKKMYADLALEHHALKDVMTKSSEPGQARGARSGNERGAWAEHATGLPRARAIHLSAVLSAAASR